MISFSNVSKAYRQGTSYEVILHNQTFDILDGQHLGVLTGPAAGKTTLIRLLAGIEETDEGSLIITGTTSWPIGMAAGFHPELTGEENVRMLVSLYNLVDKEITCFCHEFSELGESFFQPIKTYSSGMRAALGFALSMSLDFDIYIADENVGVGNEEFRAKCEVMLEARIANKTFVFASRNQRALERLCDSVAVLYHGQIIMCKDFNEAAFMLEGGN